MGWGSQSSFGTRAIAIVGGALLAASPAAAQLVPLPACTVLDKSRLVEWDVEIARDGAGSADAETGALVVDPQSSRRSRVLFVTRIGTSARLYRLTPGLNMKKDAAEAKSWDLGSFLTGGIRLRPSKDGPVFINTVLLLDSALEGSVVAVDPNSNTRTIWPDRPAPVTFQTSDVEVDKRGSGFGVFTAAPEYNPVVPNGTPLTGGVVQRLRPGKPGAMNPDGTINVPAEVTRWRVGGGAGTCDEGNGSATAPCIPGVAVDRYGKVFVSEPDYVRAGGVGAIGELDTTLVACPSMPGKQCSVVRHWPTPELTTGPRELMVDSEGIVWGITTSGEVFSLRIDRYSNKASVTRHDPVIGQGVEYMFAVAPDGGAIGFTDSSTFNKVSLLFPKNNAKPVTAVIEYVPAETGTVVGTRTNVAPSIHAVSPTVAKADTFVYSQADGAYRETNIATGMTENMTATGSLSPTGIAPDISRRTGSFYYGVGFRDLVSSHRVGQLLVNIEPERELRERRDDDDFDHDGIDNAHDNDDDDDGTPDLNDDDDDNDCIPDLMDHDKDNDGIDDDDDTNDRETVKRDSGTLAPGQVVRYDMESDANSRALVAVVEAADLTVPFAIDIVNPAGVVVLSVPSIGGKAIATATPVLSGFYTIQVRNTGLKSTAYTTKVIGRSIWF